LASQFTGLTANGTIDGEAIFFVHGGFLATNGGLVQGIFPGQGTGANTNILVTNINYLTNAPQMSQNATVTINACLAGFGGRSSFAQLMANRLGRTVYAYAVGMFFSNDPNAIHSTKQDNPSHSSPVYMLPEWRAPIIRFTPH
jgi:hypothetical protein